MPISDNSSISSTAKIAYPDLVNIYGCKIGDGTQIGPFVEIQRGVEIGRMCKIQSHSFICEGVTIGDGVFVGHGVMFTNDRYPKSIDQTGSLIKDGNWELEEIIVKDGVSIGTNAVILPGITLETGAIIGAGAVVTRSVPANTTVVGNPAKIIRRR
jgi:acetyltransferase-like isoleucine patch superfamily enzyme